jgi:hypothetical protein
MKLGSTALPQVSCLRLRSPQREGGIFQLCAGRQQQLLSAEKQIDQATNDKQLMRILLQSSVTHLHKSEFQLHDLEGVLHLRPHARFRPVPRPLLFVNPVLITIATVSVVLRRGGRTPGSLRFVQTAQAPKRFDKSRFRAGTLAASARATDRTRGTGGCWRNWSASATDRGISVAPSQAIALNAKRSSVRERSPGLR